MATQLTSILRHIRPFIAPVGHSEFSDVELLQRFLDNRDEWAFRVLVERHGRMVFSVCRHVLRQTQDAEDAFQATFLVLAQRADSIRQGTALAGWLYGVAYRTALAARLRASRRRRHEKRAGERARSQIELDAALRELQAILAEEVNRLPEKYRAPFVLCCLEGKSRNGAAAQLGWKDGTLSGRLAEARRRLQRRLERRGLTLAAAVCVGTLADTAAAVSPGLARATIQAALGGAAASLTPSSVAALAEGVTRSILLGKIKLAALAILVLGLTIAGVAACVHQALTAASAAPESASPPPAAAKPGQAVGKEGMVLRGRVLGPDGKPVAGARLLWTPPLGRDQAKKGPAVLATTADDGRFRVTIPRADRVQYGTLLAVAEGLAMDWMDITRVSKGDVTLRLAKDVPIEGRLIDLEGRPLAGVQVRVLRVETMPGDDLSPFFRAWKEVSNGHYAFSLLRKRFFQPAFAGIPASVKTDGRGRFRITGVGQERFAILLVEGPAVEKKTLYVLCRDKADIKALTRRAPGAHMPGMPDYKAPALHGPVFEQTIGPTRLMEGVVRAKDSGKPLAGVRVLGGTEDLWNFGVQTTTDRDGRYRLIGLPKAPKYHLSAYADGKVYLPLRQSLDDREGIGPLTVDFDLVRGVRIRGRVTDKATGQPLSASVWYYPLLDNKYFPTLGKSEWGSQGRTTEDGTFTALGLPGSGLLLARAESTTGVNPCTQVWLDPVDRPKAHSGNADPMGPSFVAATGEIVFLQGHNAYRLIDVASDAREPVYDLQLDRGRSVAGFVRGPDGEPLRGTTVAGLTAVLNDPLLLEGDSFRVIALDPAHPRLLVFLHRERKLSGHISLPSEAKERVKVGLRPWGVLTGRLLDERDQPRAGVRVGIKYREHAARRLVEKPELSPVETDRDGRFRIEVIFPGLEGGIGFLKGRQLLVPARKEGPMLVPDEKYGILTLPAGVKDLGDIIVIPYRRSE